MDCSAPAMVEMGKTECCTIENETGCCMPNQNSTKMQEIGIYLGAVTAALAAMCIYCFWCRKNQSVVKVQQFVASKFHRLQETCKCISCCRRQVESRRRLEALKEAAREVPALQLPSEASAQDPTFDTFWNGQMVKST
ncbi:uncharacterized protein LOC127850485 [Dreissena polymorpha]|uniref:Transmembrane protein n=1 Tax=Dreissena polymorpha TaxID=45954 RepID=A0A9D4S463_DREPO|nr:uncharacterized protein LOC127850485 [Dreissena polymorpha]XP_052239541.1 uncharacterized protein LOC127850485 [Dreissena polymorpha]KAH3889843.1 hypothetical protein DPMN_013908 [Dreissena polymorpha]